MASCVVGSDTPGIPSGSIVTPAPTNFFAEAIGQFRLQRVKPRMIFRTEFDEARQRIGSDQRGPAQQSRLRRDRNRSDLHFYPFISFKYLEAHKPTASIACVTLVIIKSPSRPRIESIVL